MAIEKVVKISVDQVQAAGGLENFVNGLEKTETKTQSLRAELRQLRDQLAQLPEGSEEFNKVAQRAGQVSDSIGDISARVRALGSDTKNIDAVVQGAQTLAGAFSVASSASLLLGEDNKDLQEQMAKVEAAIGLTVGIQSIANALQKESALVIGITNVATKVQIGLQLAYATVVGTTTGALKALRVALISTGVGAIVVALGFLIAKLTESADATEDLEGAQKDLNDELDRSNKLYSEYSKSIDFSTKTKVLNAKIAGASEKEIQALEKQGLKDKLQNLKDEELALRKSLENEKASADQKKKIIDSITAKEIEQKDLKRQIELDAKEFDLSIANDKREREKKANDDARQKAKEQQEKLDQQRKEEREKSQQNAKELADILAEQENKKIEVIKQGQKILEDLELAKETPAQKLKREYEEKLAILNEANLSTIQLTADYNIKLFESQKESNDKIIQLQTEQFQKTIEVEQAIVDAKRNALDTSLNILSQFAGKNKAVALGILAIQKGLAIADIVVNASKSIATQTSGYAASDAVASATLGPVASIPFILKNKVLLASGIGATKLTAGISIASILAAGIGQAKSITGGGGSSGGGGGGGSAGGGSSTPPSFNIVGQNSNNQLAQSIANQQQQPIQAYVVSGNVSNAQSLDRNRINTATFN